MAATGTPEALPYLPQGLRDKYLLGEVVNQGNTGSSADIDWEPNLDQYLRRARARAILPGLERDVPPGWPKSLTSPLVWSGTELTDDVDVILYLNEQQRTEITDALSHFKSIVVLFPLFSHPFFINTPACLHRDRPRARDSGH
jgi:hypothetical protein